MENFDQIERYLLDRMSAEEKSAFEVRLQNEPDLNKEKEELAQLILGVESLGLKNKLKGRTIREEDSGKVIRMNANKGFSIRNLAAAASVAAVIFCGWWFLQPDVNPNDELFSQAFITDPGLPTKMSETNHYDFYDAMVEYKMENYDKALEIWTKNTTNIGQDTLDYYIGMALLNQNKLDEATGQLNKIQSSSALYNKSNWYLLSILIEKGEFQKAKEKLAELSPSVHSSYDDVKAYLESK